VLFAVRNQRNLDKYACVLFPLPVHLMPTIQVTSAKRHQQSCWRAAGALGIVRKIF
jgi:hypothetical protein